MTEALKPGDAPSVPPPGGPYVPPPDAGQPPNSPAPVPPVKVEVPPTQERVFTPPPPAPKPPEVKPPAAPASPASPESGPTELLGNITEPSKTPETPTKPSLEALKLPQGYETRYQKEFLAEIVSTSASQEVAQQRLDTAHKLVSSLEQGLVAKNSEWINSLKQDPEVGKSNWEASVELYRKGVVEEFGVEFAKKLAEGKLDAEPSFFKAVVRRMRAKNPKPVVTGQETPKADNEPKTTEEFAKQTYAGMKTGYKTVPGAKGPGW